jgi:hypothetical protein
MASVTFWLCTIAGLVGSIEMFAYAVPPLIVVIAIDAYSDWPLFRKELRSPRVVRVRPRRSDITQSRLAGGPKSLTKDR